MTSKPDFRMKIFLLLIFSLIRLNCFAQEHQDSIKYSLCIYYGCEDHYKKITKYSIENRRSDTIIYYNPDSLGICYIPNDSTNILYTQAPLVYNRLVFNKNTISIIDTITIPPIYKAPIQSGFRIGPTYYQYYFCGKQCNGYLESFRKNGQLWQKGHFKRGDAKCFKSYYPDGSTEYIIRKRLMSGCDKTYEESGKLNYKMTYFLFFSQVKIFVKENGKYYKHLFFKRYK